MQMALRQVGLLILGIGMFILVMSVAFAIDGSDLFKAHSGVTQTAVRIVEGLVYDQ